MAKRLHQRPSLLVSVSDPYAAFCFDEAIYLFGTYVDGELAKAGDGAKNAKVAARKREMALRTILKEEDPIVDQNGKIPTPQLDPDDPVSPETAARMPPAKKFSGMKFADPADRFKKA